MAKICIMSWLECDSVSSLGKVWRIIVDTETNDIDVQVTDEKVKKKS